MSDERVPLTYEQAVARIIDGPTVHTVRNVGAALIGADWPRDELLSAIREHGCEESGPMAASQGYAVALHHGTSWLYVATRPTEVPGDAQ